MKFLGVFLLLCAVSAFSGPTFSPSPKGGQKGQPNTAEKVTQALNQNDISSVSLRVEGASFKTINLVFPEFIVSAHSAKNQEIAKSMRAIIENDLGIVGGFSLKSYDRAKAHSNDAMKSLGFDGIGQITLEIGSKSVVARLEIRNFLSGKRSVRTVERSHKDKRRQAHLLSKAIFEEFIGPEDIFISQIASVKRTGTTSQIVLFDFDGENQENISYGNWSKVSPYFPPDGKSILYTVINREGQGIVEQEIGAKTIQFRSKVSGLNLDPRVLPNNSGLLLTLSYGKQANIYLSDRKGQVQGSFTESLGMNLSPSISPKGDVVVFVSTRSGSPQIYEQSLLPGDKSAAKRLTFQGNYNQTPDVSPDGELVLFTGRDENKVFDIFAVNRKSLRVSRVTEKQGRNQEPHFTKSGRGLVFTSIRAADNGEPNIYYSSLNGMHQVRLTKSGGFYSPVIRPQGRSAQQN
jgi:TolB protein